VIAYADVQGDTVEEYGANLLAYAGERIAKVIATYGEGSPEVEKALNRWSEIFRLQVKMWPDDVELGELLDDLPHQH